MATPRKRRRDEAEDAQEEEEVLSAPTPDTAPLPSASTSENRNDEYLVVLAKHKGQIFKVKEALKKDLILLTSWAKAQ